MIRNRQRFCTQIIVIIQYDNRNNVPKVKVGYENHLIDCHNIVINFYQSIKIVRLLPIFNLSRVKNGFNKESSKCEDIVCTCRQLFFIFYWETIDTRKNQKVLRPFNMVSVFPTLTI